MNQELLEKLNAFCADFKSFRANTQDGQGKSLHDIKNTFDYVVKTVDTYQLTGTKFGSNLSGKAKEASQVLSKLWTCLDELEKSISNFTNNQTNNNNLQSANLGPTATKVFSARSVQPNTTDETREKPSSLILQPLNDGRIGPRAETPPSTTPPSTTPPSSSDHTTSGGRLDSVPNSPPVTLTDPNWGANIG